MDKSSLKMPKIGSFKGVFKKLKLAVKQCYQTCQFLRQKLVENAIISKIQMRHFWTIFKQCELPKSALRNSWDFLLEKRIWFFPCKSLESMIYVRGCVRLIAHVPNFLILKKSSKSFKLLTFLSSIFIFTLPCKLHIEVSIQQFLCSA